MSVENLKKKDPFAEIEEGQEAGESEQGAIHIRIQQRNGRKSITTCQGLPKGVNFKKVLKHFKKEFCCNGNIVEDNELGTIIQLTGDQRENIRNFILQEKLADKEGIHVHGF